MKNRGTLQGLATAALAAVAAFASGESLRIQTVRFQTLRLIEQPSIAWKHLSAEGLTFDSASIDVDLSCSVTRQTGVLDCARADGEFASAEYVVAAIRRTRAMRVDPSQLAADDSVELRTRVTVTLSRHDLRPLEVRNAPKLTMGDVQWAVTPSAADLAAVYPSDLLRQGVTATVPLLCQIQVDQSVLCDAPATDSSGDSASRERSRQFAFAGKALMTRYVATPTLKSGAPSAGAVIATQVVFKPQD